jgi:hypothetical protein
LPRWNDRLGWTEAGPGNDHLSRDRLHHFAFAPLLARASMHGAAVEEELLHAIRAWTASTERSRNPEGYSGSLIVAYRIVALVWAHAFLTARRSHPDLEFEILRILRRDVDFVIHRLGTSFANNHLLADGFVGWLAGMSYPEFAGSAAWIERGEQVWLRELDRQVYEDGASFEHASHYHAMACEMGASYTILNRLNGRAYPEWVDARVHAMLRLHADMAGPGGTAFEYGDGVEDPLLPIGDVMRWGVRITPVCFLRSSVTRRGRPPATTTKVSSGSPAAGFLRQRRRHSRHRCGATRRAGSTCSEDAESRTRLLFRTGPVDGLAVNPGTCTPTCCRSSCTSRVSR